MSNPAAAPVLSRSVSARGPAVLCGQWKAAVLLAALSLGLAIATLPPLKIALGFGVIAVAVVIVMWPEYGLYALAITVPWGSLASTRLGSIDVTISDGIVLLLTLTWMARGAYCRGRLIPRTFWNVPIVLFLLAMLFSSSQSADLALSAKELLKWIELALVFFLAQAFLGSDRDVARVVAAVVLSGILEACLGFGQFLLHAGPSSFEIYGRFLRAYGTFDQPNPYAGYMNIVAPIALAWGWVRRDVRYVLAAGFISAAMLVTFSRAGWMAGAVGLLTVAVVLSPRLRPWPFGAAFLAATGALLADLNVVSITPITGAAASLGLTGIDFQHYTTANYSEIERAAHWVAGLRMFAAHPLLGVGIGNYPVAYPLYQVGYFSDPLGHAHDVFINFAAEAGVFGLAAYILFLSSAIWYALTIARGPCLSQSSRALAVGVTGAWASSTFHNIFDVLFVHSIPILLGLLMGTLLMCASDMDHPAPAVLDRPRPERLGTRDIAASVACDVDQSAPVTSHRDRPTSDDEAGR